VVVERVNSASVANSINNHSAFCYSIVVP